MRRNLRVFWDADSLRATHEERAEAWGAYFGYFGTYAIDERAGTITHHIEASSFPNLVGTEQIRRFTFRANRLALLADAAWGRVSIVWEKLIPLPMVGVVDHDDM